MNKPALLILFALAPFLLNGQALRVNGGVIVTNGGGIIVMGTNGLAALNVLGQGTTAAYLRSDSCTALDVFGGGGCYSATFAGAQGIAVTGTSDFHGNLNDLSGNLTVFNGIKNAIVPTSQGNRKLYCEESSQVWFADYGFGQLTNGAAIIKIDDLFAETVNLSRPYHVFLQLNDAACDGLAIVNRTPHSFEVRELRHGRSAASFSYRLVALRRGFEGQRIEPADPN